MLWTTLHRAFTVVWLVLGLGYMFMITEHLSEGQYVHLLRKVSKRISKRFRRSKQRDSTTNNNNSRNKSNSAPAIRMTRSLRVTFPEEKTMKGHKKLCASASV